MAEGVIKQEYADYIAAIPSWVIGVSLLAAITRVLGAIGLLLRRAWALTSYVISLLCVVIIMFRAFVLADVASVIRTSQIGVEILVHGAEYLRRLVLCDEQIKRYSEVASCECIVRLVTPANQKGQWVLPDNGLRQRVSAARSIVTRNRACPRLRQSSNVLLTLSDDTAVFPWERTSGPCDRGFVSKLRFDPNLLLWGINRDPARM